MRKNVNIHINNECYGNKKGQKSYCTETKTSHRELMLKFTVLPHAQMYESTLRSKLLQKRLY